MNFSYHFCTMRRKYKYKYHNLGHFPSDAYNTSIAAWNENSLKIQLKIRKTCELVMHRITATATAVNRMLVWKPQSPCGCEYHNRNRGYFFQQPRIFKKKLFKKSLFYLFWSLNCNYVIATYYFFLWSCKREFMVQFISQVCYT